MKVLEQFLISLGMKVDEKSFQKADNAFGGLTRSALQLGAVLAGKLAIDKVVGDFKNAGTQLDNFHKLTGMNTQRVQALGQAFAAMGGDASEAMGTFQKVQDLMKSPLTGKIEWAGEAAKFGFDPDVILQANSTAEALANIAGEMEKLPPLQKRMAAQALGFNDDETRVLIRGREEFEKLIDVRGKLGIMTGKQVEDAARLTKANSELNQVFDDMGNTIAGELTPALAEMAEDFVKFYRDNKDLVDSGLKEFFGGVAENIQLVAAAMALMGGASALKGLAALRAILGVAKMPSPALPGPTPAPGVAATGLSLLTKVGVPLAAAVYSSKLNEGEAEELTKNRMRKGGAQAAGPVIDYLRSKGISEVLSKGIAANIQAESNFNSKAVGDSGQAYGLLQWRAPRQEDFKKYLGKDIKGSSDKEQLDFLVHEILKGNERKNWSEVVDAQTPYEAAAKFSRKVVRPGIEESVKELRAKERGEIADSYAGSPPSEQVSRAPEVSAEEILKLTRRESQEGFLDQTKTLLDSYRKTPEKPEKLPEYDEPGTWQPIQREAPREYSVNAVVQPPPQASPAVSQPSAGPVAPTPHVDNRQYHIHGADTEKVKQVIQEQMSGLIDRTAQDFKGPER